MTPKEKAEELVLTYLRIDNNTKEWFNKHITKQCALIAVDEIYNGGLYLRYGAYLDEFEDKQNYYSYWEDVKREINNLK